MQSQKEITDAIAKLTIEIRERYPEISKYINEMPVTNPDQEHPQMSDELLNEYYDTLRDLVDKYSAKHEPTDPGEVEKTNDEKL
jgi:hypothetical protein